MSAAAFNDAGCGDAIAQIIRQEAVVAAIGIGGGTTPHGRELNDTAFRLATDIMIKVSYESNGKLAELIAELCRRNVLVLRNGYSADRVGRLIGDGARGVNQGRPPIPNDEIAARYRDIADVILFGCAALPPKSHVGEETKVVGVQRLRRRNLPKTSST